MHTRANSWTMCSGNHKSANYSQKIYVKKIRKYPVGETRILDSIILRKAQGQILSVVVDSIRLA